MARRGAGWALAGIAVAGLAWAAGTGPGAPAGAARAGTAHASTAHASTGPDGFAGVYDLYLGGLKGGEMTLSAVFEDEIYRAEASARTAGMLSLVFDAGFEARTAGTVIDGQLTPERFRTESFAPGRTRTLEMRYEGGTPSAVVSDPPLDPEPWQVDPRAQEGIFDPISAALTGLALQPGDRLCDRVVEVFDGRRRYEIELGAPEAEEASARVTCPATYRRVGGFEPELMERPPFPFTVWLAEGTRGLWHVARASGETPAGIATVIMRTE